jgi:hypothetical protein
MKIRLIALLIVIAPLAFAALPPFEHPQAPACDIVSAIQHAQVAVAKINEAYYCSSADFTEHRLVSDPKGFESGHWRIRFYLPKDRIKEGKFKDMVVLVSLDGSKLLVITDPESLIYQVSTEKTTEPNQSLEPSRLVVTSAASHLPRHRAGWLT